MTPERLKEIEDLKEPFRKKYWEAFFNGARHDEMLDQTWPWLIEQIAVIAAREAIGGNDETNA